MSVPLLLSPKQVRLNKPGVMIIDARSFKDYHRGHIPGAVNFPLAEYHWADTSPEGIKAFTNHMERLLGFVGVSRNSHVIFYEDTRIQDNYSSDTAKAHHVHSLCPPRGSRDDKPCPQLSKRSEHQLTGRPIWRRVQRNSGQSSPRRPYPQSQEC